MRALTALLFLCWLLPAASAHAAEIRGADHFWQGEHRLVVRMDLAMNLPEILEQALANGIGAEFRAEVRLNRRRGVFGERTVAEASRRVRFEYYALSRHYVVTDVDGQRVELAATLGDGLDALARRLGRVALDLDPGAHRAGARYTLAARVLVDLPALPVPLQWDARLRGTYVTQIRWHRWPLS